MKILLAALLFLTAGVQSPAPAPDAFDPATLSEKGRAAFYTVHDAAIFRLGGVGFAGTTSGEELALRVLITEPNGGDALAELTEHGTPEGNLLALYGLRCVDPQRFAAKLAVVRTFPPPRPRPNGEGGFRTEEGNIAVQSGCIVSQEKWTDMLRKLERGHYASHCPQSK